MTYRPYQAMYEAGLYLLCHLHLRFQFFLFQSNSGRGPVVVVAHEVAFHRDQLLLRLNKLGNTTVRWRLI